VIEVVDYAMMLITRRQTEETTMYNTDFLQQIEQSRRNLFGNSGLPPSIEDCARYSLPPSLKVVRCIQNTNGEWTTPKEQPPTDYIIP